MELKFFDNSHIVIYNILIEDYKEFYLKKQISFKQKEENYER